MSKKKLLKKKRGNYRPNKAWPRAAVRVQSNWNAINVSKEKNEK